MTVSTLPHCFHYFIRFVLILSLAFYSSPSIAQAKTKNPLPKWGPHMTLDLKAGNRRSILQPIFFLPFLQDHDSMLFFDIRGKGDTNSAAEGNVAIAYRQIFGNWVLGGYSYFDRARTPFGNYFNQITLGLEALHPEWEARANLYLPITDRKLISSQTSTNVKGSSFNNIIVQVKNKMTFDTPLAGFDGEIGYEVLKDLRVFAGGYHFQGKGISPINGGRFRFTYNLLEYNDAQLALQGETLYDSLRKNVHFVGVLLTFPFGEAQSYPKSSTLTPVEKLMVRDIVRDVDIQTEDSSLTTVATEERVAQTEEKAIHVIPPGGGGGGGGGGSLRGSGTKEDPYVLPNMNALNEIKAANPAVNYFVVHQGPQAMVHTRGGDVIPLQPDILPRQLLFAQGQGYRGLSQPPAHQPPPQLPQLQEALQGGEEHPQEPEEHEVEYEEVDLEEGHEGGGVMVEHEGRQLEYVKIDHGDGRVEPAWIDHSGSSEPMVSTPPATPLLAATVQQQHPTQPLAIATNATTTQQQQALLQQKPPASQILTATVNPPTQPLIAATNTTPVQQGATVTTPQPNRYVVRKVPSRRGRLTQAQQGTIQPSPIPKPLVVATTTAPITTVQQGTIQPPPTPKPLVVATTTAPITTVQQGTIQPPPTPKPLVVATTIPTTPQQQQGLLQQQQPLMQPVIVATTNTTATPQQQQGLLQQQQPPLQPLVTTNTATTTQQPPFSLANAKPYNGHYVKRKPRTLRRVPKEHPKEATTTNEPQRMVQLNHVTPQKQQQQKTKEPQRMVPLTHVPQQTKQPQTQQEPQQMFKLKKVLQSPSKEKITTALPIKGTASQIAKALNNHAKPKPDPKPVNKSYRHDIRQGNFVKLTESGVRPTSKPVVKDH